jgi:tetracenomycin A2 monooxygenase-dioxygenase
LHTNATKYQLGPEAAEVIETQVVIVGGGPVGMGLGLELARFGVRSVIIERNESTTTHPKSGACTSRSMENFRIWGIEDEVSAGGISPDRPNAMWICESITGRMIGSVGAAGSSIHTPSLASQVGQDVVERAIAGALSEFTEADLRRSTEFLSFEEDADGVTVHAREIGTGTEFAVRAPYLIACDGAGSRVRKALGIKMVGPDVMGVFANYYYWADTSKVPQACQGVMHTILPADPSIPPGWVRPGGPDNERWTLLQPHADGQEVLTEDELIPIVRAHWGIPDLEVRLISVLVWRMSAQIPESFGKGRVLLAGDAAHRFPPAGGMGLNSGIQDVMNLGWKLAMVVGGHASPRLLDTYEPERRPIAESNNEWSQVNARRLPRVNEIFASGDPHAIREALAELTKHMENSGQGFGKIYDQGAFIDDDSPRLPHDSKSFWPSDRPGSRFPHMWLDAALSRSTIDWFDRSFVLVCGPNARAWQEAGGIVSARGAVPLAVHTLPSLAGPFTFPADGAVLVRPDGIVAWRPVQTGGDLVGELEATLADLLSGAAFDSSYVHAAVATNA